MTAVEFEYEGRTAPLPQKAESALTSSSLVGVTSSVGGTIESLSGLMRLEGQNEVINQVQNLVSEAKNEDEETESTTEKDEPQISEPMSAVSKIFNITNRDRMYLNLSRLPYSFHAQVNQSFEQVGTLQEYIASQLAKRLIEDEIHIDELKKAGYDDGLVTLVKAKMVTFGV